MHSDFRIAAETLVINAAKLETPSGGAELSGVLALDDRATNDWHGRLRELSNDLLLGLAYRLSKTELPIGGGTLNGTFACKGPWRRAEANAELVATALRVAEEPVARVEIRVATTLPRWTLFANVARTPSETLTIQGAGDGETNLQLALDSTPLHLDTLRGAGRRRLTGVVTLEGQISGALREPSGALQVTATGVGAGGHQLGDLSVHADGKAGAWALRAVAFADTLTANATLRSVGGLPFSLALAWHDTDLSQSVSEDRSLNLVTSGTLNVNGTMSAPDDLSGALRVTRFEVRRDQAHRCPKPIQIRLDHGRDHIEALDLVAAGQPAEHGR